MEEYFNKCVGRIMESLEVAGIQNKSLKQQVKKYIWLLLDDIKQGEESGESNGNKY